MTEAQSSFAILRGFRLPMGFAVGAAFAALLAAAGTALAGHESSIGIRAVKGHMHSPDPANFKYAFDFDGPSSTFAGTWRAMAGGGEGVGAALSAGKGAAAGAQSLCFSFDLEPGGQTWAFLHIEPGRFSPVEIEPGDGLYFRARTSGAEMDGWPARWRLRIRLRDKEGALNEYWTEEIEFLPAWQSYFAGSDDFANSSGAGPFAAGPDRQRLVDASFVPVTEKYRTDELFLDRFMVFCPGRKIPGIDTDGDGIPDLVDGDDDNNGVLDFAQGFDRPLVFSRTGYVRGGGRWSCKFTLQDRWLDQGETLSVDASLRIESGTIARAVRAIPEIVGLLAGERRYDGRGRFRSMTNHMISTMLTPSGLPIESVQILVPTRHVLTGSPTQYGSPIDAICRVPLSMVGKLEDELLVDFSFRIPVTSAIPDGLWWIYFEFGVVDTDGLFVRLDSLPGDSGQAGSAPESVSSREENLVFEKKVILPPVRVGSPKPPRMPWALLFDREVHGVKGIVPEEEKGLWALNFRNRLESRPIYPPGTYCLEPGFPSLAYGSSNFDFPLAPRSGVVSVSVKSPDGTVTDFGAEPLAAMTRWGASTRTGRTSFDFRQYGEYEVRMTGSISDAYGNTYQGGGTYRLWIAERITFGTFPSLPYTVGQAFHGAIEVVPPVPADVTLKIDFYPQSDRNRKETFTTSGKADKLGLFTAPKSYVFRLPGEYFSCIDASYTDPQGRLWMSSLNGAMVVAPAEPEMIVHGRAGYMLNGDYFSSEPRFSLGSEGRLSEDTSQFLFYPHFSGDVLYMSATMDHANAVYPMVTASFPDGFVPYGGRFGKHAYYPLFPTTRSGMSPFCHPEGMDVIAYFYADAWRPGVSGRHVIGIAQMENTYWSVSPSLLGRQMHSCENGDLPGDYYRFTGGVVYRDLKTGESRYGVYASMGVITPKGTCDNRVAAPCTEPLFELNGRSHHLFLGGGVLPVPGMIVLEGGGAPAGGAANPPVPAKLKTTVTAPSGKAWRYELEANLIGVFPRGRDTVTPLSEPGVWRAKQELSYGGKTGDVLGTTDGEYMFFVLPRDESRRFDLDISAPPMFRIEPGQTVSLSGLLPPSVSGGKLYYSTVSPGVILEEGEIDVESGFFFYEFDPWETGRKFPFYDTTDVLTGKPALCDTVVFNLFFEGVDDDGSKVWGSRVIVMRGDTVINVVPADPPFGGRKKNETGK